MKIFPKIKNNKLYRLIQGQSRHRATLDFLKAAGYGMPEIRAALLKLNGIKEVAKLVDGHQISPQTLYATLTGVRHNQLARMIIADALGFHVPEIFPDDEAGDPS